MSGEVANSAIMAWSNVSSAPVFVSVPIKVRTKLVIALKNLSSAVVADPSGFNPANFCWNIELLSPSDTNSFKLLAPYAVSSSGFASLYNVFSFLVIG